MSAPPRRRCAIYTRKSSEEGLDQSFNSLDAQREACEAYILSQAGEGWESLPECYDDGGWSGGNMERPALRALLADIARGRIDIVVVYKVDRLTRSLMDFARIVEILDGNGTSFVSVTQAFNTTNSMGRLTLNVLLSFAQFEREVTGERIRDKIAASRAKGMFMGGNIPLGYDLGKRKLEINEVEARTVRQIFARYLELKSLPALARELAADGTRSKRWTSRAGKVHGGLPFHGGALAHILRNQLYLGHAVHKGKVHRGEHDAIVSASLFRAVQDQLDANRLKRSRRKTRASASPLMGKIRDADGQPMSVSFSYGRGRKIYRYYISDCLLPRTSHARSNRQGQRLPAAHLEECLRQVLEPLFPDADPFEQIEKVLVNNGRAHIEVAGEGARGDVSGTKVLLERARAIDPEARLAAGQLHLSVSLPPQRRGRTIAAKEAQGDAPKRSQDLATLVRDAHRILAGHAASPFAPQDHPSMTAAATHWARRRLIAAQLAPEIQKAMLTGQAPSHVTPEWVLGQKWPLDWSEQRQLFADGGI